MEYKYLDYISSFYDCMYNCEVIKLKEHPDYYIFDFIYTDAVTSEKFGCSSCIISKENIKKSESYMVANINSHITIYFYN